MSPSSFRIARLILFTFLMVPAPLLARPADVTLSGHNGPVVDVAFSKDGARLASTGDDGTLKLWDIAARKQVFSIDGVRRNSNNVRFTPDGKRVVALGSENNIVIVDAGTGKLVRSIPLPNMPGGPAALDLSPDGTLAAVVGRSKLRLVDLATGTAKAEYAVHLGYAVSTVTFSADGALIATAGNDHKAVVIDAASGKTLHALDISLNGVDVSLSVDGKTLFASSSDQVVQSIELATGAAKTLVAKGVPIFKLSTSRDGKALILGGPGHGPWLVSLPDGVRAEPAFDSDEWVKCSAISSDSRWLAGGGNGGTLFVWKNGN